MFGEESFPVECTICRNMVPLEQLNDHELTCVPDVGVPPPTAPGVAPTAPAPDVATFKPGGAKSAEGGSDAAVAPVAGGGKNVRFSEPAGGGGGGRRATEGVGKEGRTLMATGAGGTDPTALPETYTKRKALQNKVKPRGEYVGLLNQGATCYLNSLLQTLFMSLDFREEMLAWEIPEDMRTDLNVPYQLQRLLTELEYGVEAAVETKALTKSFRWTSGSHFAQHDVQELNRVLFEALQKYVDHLHRPQFLTRLFEGKLVDYIQCSVCKAQRERVDTYQDITVAIQSAASLNDALDTFCEEEELSGGNAIFCEQCQKNQPSKKGLRFGTVPPLLTVQMRRFDFDFNTLRREKVYTDVKVPVILDLSHHFRDPTGAPALTDLRQLTLLVYALERKARGAGRGGLRDVFPLDCLPHIHSYLDHYVYELYSVLAHRGTTSHGHYIAHIRDIRDPGADAVIGGGGLGAKSSRPRASGGSKSREVDSDEEKDNEKEGDDRKDCDPPRAPRDVSRGWYTFNDEWVEPCDECAILECIDPTRWQENYDTLNPPKATGWHALEAAEPPRRPVLEPSPSTTPPPPPVAKRPIPPPPGSTAAPPAPAGVVSFDTSACAEAAAAAPSAPPTALQLPDASGDLAGGDDAPAPTPSSLEVHPDRGDDLAAPSPTAPLALAPPPVSETVLYAWAAMGGEIVSTQDTGGRVVVSQALADCPLYRGDVVVAVDEQVVLTEAAFYEKIAAPAIFEGGVHFVEVLRGEGLGDLPAEREREGDDRTAAGAAAPASDAAEDGDATAQPPRDPSAPPASDVADGDLPPTDSFDLFADSTTKFTNPQPSAPGLAAVGGGGPSHRIPGQSSRMYPYMAMYMLRGRALPKRHPDRLPAYMKQWVDDATGAFKTMQEEYEAVKDVVELKAFGTAANTPFSWVAFTSTTTVWEATLRIAARMAVPPPAAGGEHTPATLRLRYYAEGKGVPGRTLVLDKEKEGGVRQQTLADVGVTPLTAVVVETRGPEDPEFKEVLEEDVRVFMSVLTRRPTMGHGAALAAASRSAKAADDDDLYNADSECADGTTRSAAGASTATSRSDDVIFPGTAMPSVVVPGTCTLRALIDRVAAAVDIPQEDLVVVRNSGSHTAQVLRAPEGYAHLITQPAARVKGEDEGEDERARDPASAAQAALDADIGTVHHIQHGDVLWCESVRDAVDVTDPEEVLRSGGAELSPFNSVNHITRGSLVEVSYHLPDEATTDPAHLIRTPPQTKCKDIRAKLAQLHNLDPTAFTMRCSTAKGRLIKDDTPVAAYSIYKELAIKMTDEKPLAADDRLVEVYYQPVNPGPVKLLKTCTVKAHALVADFKQEICEAEELAACGVTPANARVRKVLKDKKLKIDRTLSAAKWGDNILGQTAKIGVCVQKGAEGEAIPKLALFLLVRRYHPETHALSEIKEVVLMRKAKMKDLREAVAGAFNIDDASAVQLVKAYDKETQRIRGTPFGMYKWKSTSTTDAVFAVDAAVPVEDEMRGLHFPDNGDLSGFEDDALVVFQDRRAEGAKEVEQPPAAGTNGVLCITAPPKKPLHQTGKPAGGKATAARSERREVGIVIRTEWDTTPVDAPLEAAAAPADKGADATTDAAADADAKPQPTLTLGASPTQATIETCEMSELAQRPFSNDLLEDDPEDCTICFYPFEDGQPVVVLNCEHIFHSECIAPWVKQKAVCPVCQKSLFWTVES